MVFSFIQPITFGHDEQLITLSAVLSGYLNFPKKNTNRSNNYGFFERST
jgi:hypothetical protein